jgi:hypothetical protein
LLTYRAHLVMILYKISAIGLINRQAKQIVHNIT